ncbi:MAG: Do family serine endopeptidase [Elusimicrobia bacterium]|nr:Do family serine endopeptidase [Elusimicrobiota bacterium]
MDKKNLFIVLLILTGGLVLGHYTRDMFDFSGKGTAGKNVPGAGAYTQMQSGTALPGRLFPDVIKTVKPALVNISAVHIVEVQTPFYNFYFGDPFEDFFNEYFGSPGRRKRAQPETEKYRYEGTGSGFIVDPDGYVITNYHVIKDADEVKITTYDDDQYEAKVVGKDPLTDLAVVKIKSMKKFNAIRLGDSDALEVGDWVLAGGSPFGLQQTFTAGIVSAVRQDVQVENLSYSDLIQTDAAINRGNSGGPLVNLQGEVIGINTAIYAPTGVFSGVGFAIPVNQAKRILTELIQTGKVVRGWLGIEIMDLDEALKEQFALKDTKGVLVNGIMDGSPAFKAGLKRGDVIVKINGSSVENARSLQKKISSAVPGEKISITVIRDKKEEMLTAELGEIPEEPVLQGGSGGREENAEGVTVCEGIKARNIDETLRRQYDLPVSEGVLVIELDPSKKCYEIGLRVGDIIVEINRQKVGNVDDFRDIMNSADLKKGVVFDVIRDGKSVYISYQSAE